MTSEAFSRTELLLGTQGLQRLQSARVLMAGIGGVGSYAAEALARAGVGHITLIDADTVHSSNLNRQLLALSSTIGTPKVEVMAERIRQINPEASITPRQLLLTPENCLEQLSEGFDLVLDAIDTFSAKLALLTHCVQQQIPVISSMGAAGKLAPDQVKIADIADSHGCRLARKIRKELRKSGIGSGIPVVFSTEACGAVTAAETRSEDNDDTRRPLGSISYLPGIFGLFMAGEAIRRLTLLPSDQGVNP